MTTSAARLGQTSKLHAFNQDLALHNWNFFSLCAGTLSGTPRTLQGKVLMENFTCG